MIKYQPADMPYLQKYLVDIADALTLVERICYL